MKSRLVTYDDVEYGDIFTRVGFGFAPIGTIIYRDGNVVPNGFLLCDGSTKSISSYPDLATYFQTTHGRKNYYGGNGSSTFGLPSIRRINGDVSNELSTTEKVVGVFTNNKPLYQRTYISSFPSTVDETKLISINALVEDCPFIYGYLINKSPNYVRQPIAIGVNDGFTTFSKCYVTPNNCTDSNLGKNNIIIKTSVTNWVGCDVAITIKYTKTTDSVVPAGHSPDRNGIWCIKATTDPTN